MKGIILAGGTGSRLHPLTRVTNKHLLPIYKKPMIYYSIEKLVNQGIKKIILVVGKQYAGHFIELLGSGRQFNCLIYYVIQDDPLGIAHALSLTKEYVGKDNMCVILGDNIFGGNINMENFDTGARIFLKKVKDPERYGVPEVKDNKIINIVEKPKKRLSNYAVTGIYLFDNTIYDKLDRLIISSRGEYEIVEAINLYIKEDKLDYKELKGYWLDAGTFESYFETNKIIKEKEGIR